MTLSELSKKYISTYVRTKIGKIVGKPNSTIFRCIESICIDLNAKCLKVWALTNSGGETYMFASLDTEGDTTIATIGYKNWKTGMWTSAK